MKDQPSAEQAINEILGWFETETRAYAMDGGTNAESRELSRKQAGAQLQKLLEQTQANCNVESDQPNTVHMNYFNIGYEKGKADANKEQAALLIRERLDEANRIPNPAWIGADGRRINPNERYRSNRIATLTKQLENKEKEE